MRMKRILQMVVIAMYKRSLKSADKHVCWYMTGEVDVPDILK